eukprot:scaffold1130_cov195-Pinguiococcus_pyrenoidosus.AAC.43
MRSGKRPRSTRRFVLSLRAFLGGVVGYGTHRHLVLSQLTPIVLSPLRIILSDNGEYLEFLESGLEILQKLLKFYPNGISAELWGLFPSICGVFMDFAHDFIKEMVPSFLWYICRNPEAFLRGTVQLPQGPTTFPGYMSLVLQKVFSNEYNSNTEKAASCYLMLAMMHSCPGAIDAWIPGYLKLAVGGLRTCLVEDQVSAESWMPPEGRSDKVVCGRRHTTESTSAVCCSAPLQGRSTTTRT